MNQKEKLIEATSLALQGKLVEANQDSNLIEQILNIIASYTKTYIGKIKESFVNDEEVFIHFYWGDYNKRIGQKLIKNLGEILSTKINNITTLKLQIDYFSSSKDKYLSDNLEIIIPEKEIYDEKFNENPYIIVSNLVSNDYVIVGGPYNTKAEAEDYIKDVIRFPENYKAWDVGGYYWNQEEWNKDPDAKHWKIISLDKIINNNETIVDCFNRMVDDTDEKPGKINKNYFTSNQINQLQDNVLEFLF